MLWRVVGEWVVRRVVKRWVWARARADARVPMRRVRVGEEGAVGVRVVVAVVVGAAEEAIGLARGRRRLRRVWGGRGKI